MSHDDTTRQIAHLFLGGASRPRRPRSKPNRCLGCGKVSRHIFCTTTTNECRALYYARQKED